MKPRVHLETTIGQLVIVTAWVGEGYETWARDRKPLHQAEGPAPADYRRRPAWSAPGGEIAPSLSVWPGGATITKRRAARREHRRAVADYCRDRCYNIGHELQEIAARETHERDEPAN